MIHLLSIIADRDGDLNWYIIGRKHLHEFENPSEFDQAFKALSQLNLVEEKLEKGENLPKLFLTDKGRSIITEMM